MRLLNQSFKTLSVSLLLIISIWSVIFYFVLRDEIYDSIDDGLEDYKEFILRNVDRDTSVLKKHSFDESNYVIEEIDKIDLHKREEEFRDTLISLPYEDDPEPMRMLTTEFEKDGKYYRLRIISSMVEEDDLIENFVSFLAILYGILLISIFVINNVFLRKLWTPFYDYLQKLKSFKIDQNTHSPNIKSRTLEFIELNRACDELIEYAQKAYTNQKQFIENAAHELQTPLAVINSKLELLLEKNSLDPEDASIIVDVFHKVQHLSQLNKSLLLLGKIENKQFFDNQDITVNEIVKEVIVQFLDFAEHKSIAIRYEEPEQLIIRFDRTLLEILVTNLVKNAVIHNNPKGRIEVKIKDHSLSICNTSPHPKLPNGVFERFYKGADSVKGTGLGLAIANAICDLYGLELRYHYSQWHCFEVKFK